MLIARAPLPSGAAAGIAIAFPGHGAGEDPGAAPEPLALLSFACAGDMKFGDPARTANRGRFLRDAGIDPERSLGLALAHSRTVLYPADGEDPAALALAVGGADGLVLGSGPSPRPTVTVTVADCMPIWILDRGSGAYGLLHSGWRGTGILGAAITGMAERYGSRPSSMAVILGPAIGPCCYEVHGERAAAFAAEFGEACVRRREGASFLDLREANVLIAERAGVGDLLSIEACTCCDGRLGSYRRQGAASFTRMLAACGPSPLGPGPSPLLLGPCPAEEGR